jgi:neural cell adhesion molecule
VVLATLFLFLCRKGPVETKSEPPESEAKPAPTEVKTVPNDATQTKENESKA